MAIKTFYIFCWSHDFSALYARGQILTNMFEYFILLYLEFYYGSVRSVPPITVEFLCFVNSTSYKEYIQISNLQSLFFFGFI